MAELSAAQQQDIEAIIAEALRSDAGSDAQLADAAALASLGDLKGLFCKNWPTVKGVLTFIKTLPVGGAIKAAIDQIIRIGDGAHGVIC